MQADSSQLLALRDIHVPTSVSWWPLSPLAWSLIIIGLVVVAALLFWWRRGRRHRDNFSAQAINSLNSLHKQFAAHRDAQRYLADMSSLLRRLLVLANADIERSNTEKNTSTSNKHYRQLRGEQLCEYLNSLLHRFEINNPEYFSPADFRLMDKALYQKQVNTSGLDSERLQRSTQQLIAAIAMRRQASRGKAFSQGQAKFRSRAS